MVDIVYHVVAGEYHLRRKVTQRNVQDSAPVTRGRKMLNMRGRGCCCQDGERAISDYGLCVCCYINGDVFRQRSTSVFE